MDKPSLREERVADEIDLRIVFRKLASFFRRGLHKLENIFLLLLRRWPLVLFLTLLGIGVGYLAFKMKRPFYRSSITLAPGKIRNEFFKHQVLRLATLVKDGNSQVVATDLNISLEDAAKMKSLRYVGVDSFLTVAETDSVLVGAPFKVEAELYDSKFFAPLQDALTGYFARNPFFTRSTQARKEQLRAMIDKLKVDITSIDSIKRTAITLRGPANGFVYGEPLDPTNLYKQSTALFETQAELEAELRNLETVQVVVGFAPLLHPTGPKLKWYLVPGTLFGFLLALFVVLRLESRRTRSVPGARE
jgi:hypothetical protein